MADNVTKVEYDVKDAVKGLQELDSKLDESAKKADQAFGRMEDASDDVDKNFDSLGEAVSLFSFKVNQILDIMSRVGPVIAGVAQNLAVQTFGWESAADQAEDYQRKIEAVNEVLQQFDSLENAAINSRFQKAIEELRLAQSERGVRQGEISEESAILQGKLREQQQYYNELNQIARQSANERQSLEQRLARLTADAQDKQIIKSTEGFSPGARVNQLLEAADKLSKTGEFDRAERILQEAERVAGDNAFNQRAVSQAMQSLIADVGAAAQAAAEKEKIDKQSAASAQSQVSATRDRIQALREEAAGIQHTNKLEKERQRQLQIGLQAEKRRQTRQESGREAETNIQALQSEIEGATTKLEALKNAFSATFSDFLIPTEELQQQAAAIELLDQRARSLAQTLGQDATIGDVEGEQQRIQQFIAALEELKGVDRLGETFAPDIERLDDIAERIKAIIDAAEKARSAGADSNDRLIDPSVNESAVDVSTQTNAVAQDIERAAKGAQLLEQHFRNAAQEAAKIKIGPISSGLPGQADGPGQAVPATPTQTQQTINVNASVKGGIIDGEVVREITAIIQRELRKGNV